MIKIANTPTTLLLLKPFVFEFLLTGSGITSDSRGGCHGGDVCRNKGSKQNNFKARSHNKNASYSSTCSVVDLTPLMAAEPHAKCSNHPPVKKKEKKKHPPEPRTAQRVCELEPKKCLSPWLARAQQTIQTLCRANRQTPEIISCVLLYKSCKKKKKKRAWKCIAVLGFPLARRMSRPLTQAASLESSERTVIMSHLELKRLPQLEKSFISRD